MPMHLTAKSESDFLPLPPHLTGSIPRELWLELDYAAAWLSGHPYWLNKSRIITNGLLRELAHLRKLHNHGKPFGPPPNFPGHQPGRPRKHAP